MQTSAKRKPRGADVLVRSRTIVRATLGTRSSYASQTDGFSIIEFIAVMAILAILAASIAPVAVRRADKSALAKEVANLGAISNAIILQLQRSNAIPNEVSWAGVLANWSTMSSSQIATNNRNLARLFFYDGSGWLQGNVPYSQNANGTGSTPPSNLRIAIVSTIAQVLPNVNGSLSAANFNSIWNNLPSKTPTYLTSQGWTGNSYDLVIQRITLDPLFHHLVLVNRDASTAPAFTINSTSFATAVAVPSTAAGWNSYYADGTVVGLWSGTTLTNSFVLNSDTSFTFDGGMWRAQLTGASADNNPISTNLAYQASGFINTANVPGGHQGSDTQGVLSAFYDFMYAYTVWANECPHFQTAASDPKAQADYQILNTLGANNGIIDSTTSSSGGGLLK